MSIIKEETYRSEVRDLLMNEMNSKLRHCAAQHCKDHYFRSQKMSELEKHQQQQRRYEPRSSGGDADRTFYDTSNAGPSSQADSYRNRYNESMNFNRHLIAKPTKHAAQALSTPKTKSNAHKFQLDDGNGFHYETDSNIGGGGPGSEESNKSQKSSKTVVSKKSSQDLRKMVKSQCKLHEVIDETLKQMCSTEPDHHSEGAESRLKEHVHMGLQKPPASCKRCTEKVYTRTSPKDVMTEVSKGEFLECRSGDTLTISVDDVVNSKVINPMIRKLQRMYLNNLREEMSLMEDLERLPYKVNEVYKATIFKQKE